MALNMSLEQNCSRSHSHSRHLSQQSHQTDSTIITQIWNPQSTINSTKRHTLSSYPRTPSRQPTDDFTLDCEEDSTWQSRPGWEFLPPKPTSLTASARPRAEAKLPTTPNFSRPLGQKKNEEYFPKVPSFQQQTRDKEQQVAAIEHSSGGSSGQSDSTKSSAGRHDHPTYLAKSRKDRYSSKSLYSASSSDTGSRAKTEASADSYTPLIPPTRKEHWLGKTDLKQPTRPQHQPRNEYNPAKPLLSGTQSEPHRPYDPMESSKPSMEDSEPREPTLDIGAIEINEHDVITALPVVSPERPALFASAAEPPTIRDNRLLNGKRQMRIQPLRDNPQHRTEMSSFPEVMRPITEHRENPPVRRWSASTFDTSTLSPEKIAKLKKKGINPALYLEMKSHRGERKKGRLRLSPLVGNTFL